MSSSLIVKKLLLIIKHNALDKNDLDEEILEQLDIQDLENALEEMEESREEETFRNWVCFIFTFYLSVCCIFYLKKDSTLRSQRDFEFVWDEFNERFDLVKI